MNLQRAIAVLFLLWAGAQQGVAQTSICTANQVAAGTAVDATDRFMMVDGICPQPGSNYVGVSFASVLLLTGRVTEQAISCAAATAVSPALCYERDDNAVYICDLAAGSSCTGANWTAISGGGGGGGTPGGSDTYVQYNDGGAFGGDSGFTFNETTDDATLAGSLNLPATTFATGTDGVIYKNGTRFLHDFNYGNNGTVTTVGRNLFLGESAGNFTAGATAIATDDASYNTMVGYGSGFNLTTGATNTAVGYLTMNALTTGQANAALGVSALQQISTGIANVAIGPSAMSSMNTGSFNVAMGNGAAISLTGGMQNNIAIGASAGATLNDGTTPKTGAIGSTYIGAGAKSLDNTTTNETVIGYLAQGNGGNTVTLGSDSITDTYLKGEVHQAIDYGTTFPSSPTTGLIFVVTDDSSAGACDSAAGSATSICRWNGSAWAPMGGIGGESITQIFNGKTIHYSNNIVTVTSIIPLTPAACQNATAYLQWDHETANYPAAACVTGTNTQKAYADFDQTTDECLQASIPLPDDFVPADGIDAYYTWLTTATSGSVAWCSQVICTADAETDDPAFPAQASGNCVTDTAKGTTNQLNNVTDTGITITGCAASEIMHIRLCRDPNETGGQTDTVAADARLANMYLKIRREM